MASSFKPFRRENLPAYAAVMGVYTVAASMLGLLCLHFLSLPHDRAGVVFALAFMAVFVGMMIMFGASLLNLRKLRPGFQRLAVGQAHADIPPVWCPVLTSATQAAESLADSVQRERTRWRQQLLHLADRLQKERRLSDEEYLELRRLAEI